MVLNETNTIIMSNIDGKRYMQSYSIMFFDWNSYNAINDAQMLIFANAPVKMCFVSEPRVLFKNLHFVFIDC